MSEILLLGGTGFIGAAAARSLRAAGHDVLTVGRSPGADVNVDLGSDVRELIAAHPAPIVVNLAGAGLAAGTADTVTMESVNTDLPARLADALAPTGALLIHAASSTEPTGPGPYESEYSRTKHAGTLALQSRLGQPVTLLRIYNVYGPGQPAARFVAGAIKDLRARQPVVLQYPQRVRDFVYLDDVCANICAVVDARQPLPPVEVGTGTGLRLIDVAHQIADAVGADRSLVRSAEPVPLDPHPSTFAPVRYGTLGLCRTEFPTGLHRMLEAM
jgi:nucleoside-diphosphate-sugar epimerase